MSRLMMDKFLSNSNDYKMHIEHKQEDVIVQNYGLNHVNNVFDECPQSIHDDLLDVRGKKDLGHEHTKVIWKVWKILEKSVR